jgi:HEPN domain-containing protein
MDEPLKTAVSRWLIKAEHDLTTAQTMLSVVPPVTDTACFHAQQCVEKCLKAYLVAAGVHVERTHYLPRLVALCSLQDPDFQNLADTAIELTDYAVTDRYPDNWREIPETEAQDAVRKARDAMDFTRARLNL